MKQAVLTTLLVVMTLAENSKEENSLAREYELDAAVSTNKRPRNVDTVARFDLLRRGRIHPDVPALVGPTSDQDLLDISTADGEVGGGGAANAHWSFWSDWSACSRSCGGGVKSRGRRCISRLYTTNEVECVGTLKEHKLCGTQDCPFGSQDFHEFQCSRQNGKFFFSRKFKWIPHAAKDRNSCELTCMATNFHFYRSFGQAADGTRCGIGRKDICIKGECTKVGCDGVIGSNVTEDACGVCGGNNETCFHHQSVIDSLPEKGDLNSGYNKVATIPIGATRIRVKDHNKNYIALSEEEEGKSKYIINGNWVISWPGEFKTAGTVVTYGRKKERETFDIVGPTTKKLNIVVLCIRQQPLIEIEYWMPGREKDMMDGVAELKGQRKAIIQMPDGEDSRSRIIAAGLDFDAVQPPTLPPTTTASTTPPTTAATTQKKYQPQYRRPSARPSYCATCKKYINKKKSFCESDFVVHVRVLPKRRLQRGRYIRHEVEILNKYRSKTRMMRREYIWAPNTCCPRLRPYRHYLLMGRRAKVSVANAVGSSTNNARRYETRLVADHVEFWYTWRKYQIRMARAAKNINCKRYRYLAAKFYRKKLNEG